ncbi:MULTISPECIES: helix-turn-helix domain-containing protein [unclassified Mycolicibacterium]
MSVPVAARILGVSRSSGYKLTHSGELLSRRLGGRIYVVTQSLRDLGSA